MSRRGRLVDATCIMLATSTAATATAVATVAIAAAPAGATTAAVSPWVGNIRFVGHGLVHQRIGLDSAVVGSRLGRAHGRASGQTSDANGRRLSFGFFVRDTKQATKEAQPRC
jgi:hypothetical protein